MFLYNRYLAGFACGFGARPMSFGSYAQVAALGIDFVLVIASVLGFRIKARRLVYSEYGLIV